MSKKQKNVTTAVSTAVVKKERNSSFELLRIFAMLLIIGHHFVVYGGSLNLSFDEGINRFIAQFLHLGGVLGVNIFFGITGYFAVSGKFKMVRLLKIDLAAVFYSLLGVILTTLVYKAKHEPYKWVAAFLPISLENYWFITVYAAVFLLSPFFKILINKLDKKHFTALIFVMMIFTAIIPTLNFTKSSSYFRCFFLIGVYGYFMGAYLRKCPPEFLKDKYIAAGASILLYTALGIISVFANKYGDTVKICGVFRDTLLRHESPLMVFCAATIIMFFRDIELGTVKWINFISQAMLGVYMIHECPTFRGYLWGNILKTQNMIHKSYYLPRALTIIFIVFAGCTIIELARIYLLEKNLFKLRLFNGIFDKIDGFMND